MRNKRQLIKGLLGVFVSNFIVVHFVLQIYDCLNKYDSRVVPVFTFFYVLFVFVGIIALIKSIALLIKYAERK